MAVEIERKFLVRDPSVVEGLTGTVIRQGYLSTAPERTVRVRRAGERAFLTVKGLALDGIPAAPASPGAPAAAALSRPEFEYEIPVADADELLDTLAHKPLIEKTRYEVTASGRLWEVDVFGGENEGLVMAEVELTSESALVVLPEWVGAEVTADPRYFNVNLVGHPYRTWGGG